MRSERVLDGSATFAPESVALARMLLGLAQRGERGVLYVRTTRGAARVVIDAGALLAISLLWSQDDSLGDMLLRSGDLSATRHFAALGETKWDEGAPVGRWLLDAQLTTHGAVAHALRAQLRGRMRGLLTARILDTRFESGDAPGALRPIEEPLRIADVVVSCLRSLAGGLGAAQLAPDDVALELSSMGRYLLEHVALWPEEEALRALLTRNEPHAVAGLRKQHARVGTLIVILEALGGLVSRVPKERGRYGLLVRKRRQIRDGEGPYRLLELREGASSDDARKALRRLASQLHPDALGPSAPDALRRASTEVMSALVEAERCLRDHPSSRGPR
jgi:hypothetical protein